MRAVGLSFRGEVQLDGLVHVVDRFLRCQVTISPSE